MDTLLSYLTILAIAALLLTPSLYGALRERRLDRQIRAAERAESVRPVRPTEVIRAPDPASQPRSSRGAGPSVSSSRGSASAPTRSARPMQARTGPREAARG